jgi:hypothetical protein
MTLAVVAALENHRTYAIRIQTDTLEAGIATDSAGGSGTLAQPFIELLAIDHAHETAFDRNIYFGIRWRDHACRARFGDQQVIRYIKVANCARRYCATTGFDATRAVQQQNASSAPRKIMGCSGTGRAAAYDDDIELFVV